MSNYIDEIAIKIWARTKNLSPDQVNLELLGDQLQLYRGYAALALGEETVTNQMVHDVWSVWCLAIDPEHLSIVPYYELSPNVRELDSKYTKAINATRVELSNIERMQAMERRHATEREALREELTKLLDFYY